MAVYFISKRLAEDEPFRLGYREISTRTSKGYPLSFELKLLPIEFLSWESAQTEMERLNIHLIPPAELAHLELN